MFGIDHDGRKWCILAAMGAVIGTILLDEALVGVALHTIRLDLGLSEIASYWVIGSYMLAFVAVTAAGARLGEIVGLKPLLLVGIALFGLASLASGFAPNGAWLIAARAVQGLGAALILPASIAIVGTLFSPGLRGRSLSVFGATGAALFALGPLLGGLVTELLSWRWIFWINPIIAAAIALTVLLAWTHPLRAAAAPKFDVAGFLTCAGGLGMLVFALLLGPVLGWSQVGVLALFIGAVVALAVFVMVEGRHSDPLIEVRLFRKGAVSACSLVLFTAQFSRTSVIVFGALYLQQVLRLSPLGAGLTLLAAVAPVPLAAVAAGRFSNRDGARLPTICGLALTGFALAWISIAVRQDGAAWMVPSLLVYGFALPLIILPPRRRVMQAVAIEKQAQAGGTVLTAQVLGGAIGIAVCGALLATTGDFGLVYLTTSLLALAVLAFSWLALGMR